jgi:hypothetical protein
LPVSTSHDVLGVKPVHQEEPFKSFELWHGLGFPDCSKSGFLGNYTEHQFIKKSRSIFGIHPSEPSDIRRSGLKIQLICKTI